MAFSWSYFSDYLPTPIPVTVEQFDYFAKHIFENYNITDEPDHRHILASMIQHLKPDVDQKPIRHFVKCIRAAQAKMAAFDVMQAIKEEAKVKFEAEKLEAIQNQESQVEPIQNQSV